MDEPAFLPAAAVADVPEGEVTRATVGGREIVLYNLGGEFFATIAYCTHGRTHLAEGYVEGDVVECAMHGGRFDIRTGKAVGPPCTVNLRTFAVRVEGDTLLVATAANPAIPRDA
jgi:nitrite reductase/ring-hydroxylating ferredoxin subunit